MFGHQVVTDLDGNFIVQIGSTGEEGLRDGNFNDATFNRPQVKIHAYRIVPAEVWIILLYGPIYLIGWITSTSQIISFFFF